MKKAKIYINTFYSEEHFVVTAGNYGAVARKAKAIIERLDPKHTHMSYELVY